MDRPEVLKQNSRANKKGFYDWIFGAEPSRTLKHMCNLREVCDILSEFVSAVFTPLSQVLPMKIGTIKPCWHERFFFSYEV